MAPSIIIVSSGVCRVPKAFECVPQAFTIVGTSVFYESCPAETPRSYPNSRRSTRISLPGPPCNTIQGRVQCLAVIKHSDGPPGSLRSPLVASSALQLIHYLMLPNRRRLGMRLGTKLSPDDYLQTSGGPLRLSRGREVRLRTASSSAFANGMTISAGNPLGSFVFKKLYIWVVGRPLPEDQNCRSFASTSYSTI